MCFLPGVLRHVSVTFGWWLGLGEDFGVTLEPGVETKMRISESKIMCSSLGAWGCDLMLGVVTGNWAVHLF